MQWKELKSAQNSSLLLKPTPNLKLLVNQFNNATPESMKIVLPLYKYNNIDKMNITEILTKINPCNPSQKN